MASKVGICNLALIRLGSQPITAITDDTKRAIALNANYDIVLDIVLADNPWNFAISRTTLARLADAPAFGYSYQYQLPSDCLKVLGIVDETVSGNPDPTIEYKIEGGKLLTEESTVHLKYISRVTDPNLFSPKFLSAFAMRLAAEIAYHITGNASLKTEIMKEYVMELSGARSVDAQEDTPEVYQSDTWITARL